MPFYDKTLFINIVYGFNPKDSNSLDPDHTGIFKDQNKIVNELQIDNLVKKLIPLNDEEETKLKHDEDYCNGISLNFKILKNYSKTQQLLKDYLKSNSVTEKSCIIISAHTWSLFPQQGYKLNSGHEKINLNKFLNLIANHCTNCEPFNNRRLTIVLQGCRSAVGELKSYSAETVKFFKKINIDIYCVGYLKFIVPLITNKNNELHYKLFKKGYTPSWIFNNNKMHDKDNKRIFYYSSNNRLIISEYKSFIYFLGHSKINMDPVLKFEFFKDAIQDSCWNYISYGWNAFKEQLSRKIIKKEFEVLNIIISEKNIQAENRFTEILSKTAYRTGFFHTHGTVGLIRVYRILQKTVNSASHYEIEKALYEYAIDIEDIDSKSKIRSNPHSFIAFLLEEIKKIENISKVCTNTKNLINKAGHHNSLLIKILFYFDCNLNYHSTNSRASGIRSKTIELMKCNTNTN